MNRKYSLLVLFALGLGVTSARAGGLLELRVGAGITDADPNAFEDQIKSSTGEDLKSGNFNNYNFDVFFDIPAFPIGVGVRQEWINNDESSGGNSWKIDAKNLSLIADWRIINTGIYVGPIIGVGYPSADVEFNGGGDRANSQVTGKTASYFAAGEFGVKLGRFLLGAEVGYQSIVLENVSFQNGGSSKIDLSGAYGKVMAGIALF